jgi:hypothetical protein
MGRFILSPMTCLRCSSDIVAIFLNNSVDESCGGALIRLGFSKGCGRSRSGLTLNP